MNGQILLVDDRKEVYDKLEGTILKYSVDYVNNKKDALEKIRNGNYRLVVSDYDLGEEDPTGGLEIINEAVKKKTLVTILTSTENHKHEAWDIGAMFMIKKRLFECFGCIVESNTNGRK
jgi:DNA-binding response OmpR family regulator